MIAYGGYKGHYIVTEDGRFEGFTRRGMAELSPEQREYMGDWWQTRGYIPRNRFYFPDVLPEKEATNEDETPEIPAEFDDADEDRLADKLYEDRRAALILSGEWERGTRL